MIEQAILCLALNIYYEARGEPFAGQVAVGKVTLTRAKQDYANVCKIIFSPGQFSWTHSNKRALPNLKNIIERQAWQRALAIASSIDNYNDPTYGANYYHAVNVHPYWVHSMYFITKIGKHLFYKSKQMKKTTLIKEPS